MYKSLYVLAIFVFILGCNVWKNKKIDDYVFKRNNHD